MPKAMNILHENYPQIIESVDYMVVIDQTGDYRDRYIVRLQDGFLTENGDETIEGFSLDEIFAKWNSFQYWRLT